LLVYLTSEHLSDSFALLIFFLVFLFRFLSLVFPVLFASREITLIQKEETIKLGSPVEDSCVQKEKSTIIIVVVKIHSGTSHSALVKIVRFLAPFLFSSFVN